MTDDAAAGTELEPGPKRRRNRPARMLAVGLGVPLLVSAVFVVLYATGVIRDGHRADYCAGYTPISTDLGRFDAFARDLQAGDPVTAMATIAELRAQVDELAALPSSPVIENRLDTMTAFLLEAEVAARAHDGEAMAELADRLASFAADRQEFIVQSAEYCRYR
ncbi:MAG: hypothetical protein LBS56_05170 [Propionibacteriaceae bacterium]|jgi:hypothetical protein|nr:hypothetical protein [Propionibacteriaceae bacterium]